MNVIVLGAGQVGSTLAENLCDEHAVTVVDLDAERLLVLQSRLDIRTLGGSAASPAVLEEAGAKDADMVIAVTSNDETNILACQIAYSLFKVPTKIARVRNREMARYPQLFTPDNIPIDLIINPSDLVTQYLVRLLKHPGAQAVLNFAEGKVQIVGIRIKPSLDLVGQSFKEFSHNLADLSAQVVAVFRDDRTVIAEPDMVVKPHDMLLVAAKSSDVNEAIKTLLGQEVRYRRVIIAGGGNIGVQLAQEIEQDYNVKLLEQSSSQCDKAAELLQKTVVLSGDASDADLLLSENIDETDLFCSVTNDDEVNIMSAIVAKRLGAKHTFALVNRQTYAHYLIERSPDIDLAVSPQRITGGKIMRCLRKGDIANLHIMPRGHGEAFEIIVHGDKTASKVVGRTVRQLRLPAAARICSIVRQDEVLMPNDDFVLAEGDRVVLLLANNEVVSDVEKRFAVSKEFI